MPQLIKKKSQLVITSAEEMVLELGWKDAYSYSYSNYTSYTNSDTVPNSERLNFRSLSSHHHDLLQAKLAAVAHTDLSSPINMSPTQSHVGPLKIHSSPGSPSTNNSSGPYGDGDLCSDWGWNFSTLSLNPQTYNISGSYTGCGEWFAPLANNNNNNNHVVSNPQSTTVVTKSIKKDESHIPKSGRPLTLDLTSERDRPPSLEEKRKRSSSLKTMKTPPDTPGCKKIVRFADCLGLDLVDVKLFLDEIPNVPKSAFSDLQDAIDCRTEDDFVHKKNKVNMTLAPKLDKTLLPSFHEPGGLPDFFDRVDTQKVLLETCYLVDSHQIKGSVRVKNLSFDKAVHIRFTYNDWESHEEMKATYVSGSCDGFSDKFEFVLSLDPKQTRIGGKFSFACKYQCQGQEYWDNNLGRNYVFHCVPCVPATY